MSVQLPQTENSTAIREIFLLAGTHGIRLRFCAVSVEGEP